MKWTRKISFFICLLLLIFLVYRLGPVEILSCYNKFSLSSVLFSAFCVIGATIIGSVNLYIIMIDKCNVRYWKFLKIYWISWAFGLITPGQVGDIAAIGSYFKKRGVDISTCVSRSIIDKVISLLVVLLVSVYSVKLYDDAKIINFYLTAFYVIMPLIFFLLILLSLKRVKFNCFNGKIFFFLNDCLSEFIVVMSRRKRIILVNFSLTFIKFFLIGSAYWFVFSSFGVKFQSLLLVISFVALSSLVSYIPVSFNGIGTVEVVGVFLFGKLGLPDAQVLAVYLMLRVMVMFIAWAPSLILLLISKPVSVIAAHE